MQQTQKPVRYYITNQDDNQPVVRSVPVSVTAETTVPSVPTPAAVTTRGAHTRSPGRTRMARLVRATIGRHHDPSA